MSTAYFAPSLRVEDLLREAPATAEVFSRFGIDICCGASLGLAAAVAAAGASLPEVLAELRKTLVRE